MDDDNPSTGKWTRSARLQHLRDTLHSLSLRRNVTQADISRATKLGRDSISRYFRGMTLPDTLSLAALARALDVQPIDLDPGFEQGVLLRPVNNEPALEVRQDPNDPSRVFLKVYKSVSISLATQVMALLDAERRADGGEK